MTDWLDDLILTLCRQFPEGTYLGSPFSVIGLIAIVLVGLVCGAVGSMVVGNRMAFFSDALAHCAFAGVGLGLLVGFLADARRSGAFHDWGVPLITVAFGVAVGLAIAYVRDKTALASDTVIGVFFAGALGLGAVVLKELSRIGYFTTLEGLVFGDIVTVRSHDLLVLLLLGVVTAVVLGLLYNQ